MNKHLKILLFAAAIICILFAVSAQAVQNFPPPEFETDYQMPTLEIPEPQFRLDPIIDIAALTIALSLASYFSIKSRSRKSLFILMIACMLYFGFYRKGCVCSIGAIQNISLGLFDSTYTTSLVIIAFFGLPIIFSIFFGRVFCGSVCPLGAIQDLVTLKPLKVPNWLENILQMFAWLYLGLAILLAATGTAFIICRYDPFISIYRFTSSIDVLILTTAFIILSMLVGRPYCRFLCPYGVILRQTSRLAKWKISIVPKGQECIQCRLCVAKCPYDAINAPYQVPVKTSYNAEVKKFLTYVVITAILIGIGIFSGIKLGTNLAQGNINVITANVLRNTAFNISQEDQDAILEAVRASGRKQEDIFNAESEIISSFQHGAILITTLLALVAGIKLTKTIIYRSRKDYEVDDGKCLYCGRCLDACPEETNLAANGAKNGTI